MSRRLFQPSEQQRREVLALAGYGIAQHEIAGMMDIDPKTLRRAFRAELDTGAARANAAVAESLFYMATKGRVPAAAIFWLKCRAGWKEARPDDTNASNGGVVRYEFTWASAGGDTAGSTQYRQAAPGTPPVIDAAAEDDGVPVQLTWADGSKAG
jgi:hypothetical protein